MLRRPFLATFGAFIAGCGAGGASAPVAVAVAQAPAGTVQGSTGEQIATLPIDGAWRVVYAVRCSAPAGALVLISSQFELTNDTGANVGVGMALVRGTHALDTGTPVTKPCMENVTPATHHMARFLSWPDTHPGGDIYYNLVLWAVSSSVAAPAALTIEQGYGAISAIVLKG